MAIPFDSITVTCNNLTNQIIMNVSKQEFKSGEEAYFTGKNNCIPILRRATANSNKSLTFLCLATLDSSYRCGGARYPSKDELKKFVGVSHWNFFFV